MKTEVYWLTEDFFRNQTLWIQKYALYWDIIGIVVQLALTIATLFVLYHSFESLKIARNSLKASQDAVATSEKALILAQEQFEHQKQLALQQTLPNLKILFDVGYRFNDNEKASLKLKVINIGLVRLTIEYIGLQYDDTKKIHDEDADFVFLELIREKITFGSFLEPAQILEEEIFLDIYKTEKGDFLIKNSKRMFEFNFEERFFRKEIRVVVRDALGNYYYSEFRNLAPLIMTMAEYLVETNHNN